MPEQKRKRKLRRYIKFRVTLFEDTEVVAYAHFSTMGTHRAMVSEARRLFDAALAGAKIKSPSGISAPPVEIGAAHQPQPGARDGGQDPDGDVAKPNVDATNEDLLGGLSFDIEQ